jgi:DNA polymerase-3 subunit chi
MVQSKLEKAFFYNSARRETVKDIVKLTEKLYKKNNFILLYCADQETVDALDEYLWSYSEDSFIPHSKKNNEKKSLYPILVTDEILNDHEHNILLALNGVLIKETDWPKFNKVYYFFDDQNHEERENARSMWKSFSSLEIDCRYWVNKENKWILANSG